MIVLRFQLSVCVISYFLSLLTKTVKLFIVIVVIVFVRYIFDVNFYVYVVNTFDVLLQFFEVFWFYLPFNVIPVYSILRTIILL